MKHLETGFVWAIGCFFGSIAAAPDDLLDAIGRAIVGATAFVVGMALPDICRWFWRRRTASLEARLAQAEARIAELEANR